MTVNEGQAPVEALYGEGAIELVLEEVKKIALNSNFPFDDEYVRTGISFVTIKAQEILKGEKKKLSLKSLVSESFGEAAIYKFQIADKD